MLVGTLWPLFSQWVGREQSLGRTYYETVSAPLGLLIVALLGVCPALRWRGQLWPDLLRHLVVPAGAAVIAAIASVLAGSREPFVMLAFWWGAW